ncbi:polysaccharide biosynthesis/export family protein [Sandarakinorhabdus sp.]|uniref:polysaccharide biosynthesis/export family protein n=1 Tax=Sandarakinorhabdus sp. TaxID=1916663 RepID=UPI0028A86D77|nr:polysaccharide biosynthesis/export family protein [Sandarakinorhabdus sp.]
MIASGLALAACQPFGPGRQAVLSGGTVPPSANEAAAQIKVVQVRGDMAAQFKPPAPWPAFADVLAGAKPVGTVVGTGDALEVTIWEAPPAALFGGATDTRIGTAISTARPTTLPELLVGPEGSISVPFAGQVPAGGRTLREIEADIVRRLRGRANAPQAIVRLVRNTTATVTVVGEVTNSARLPISPRGERLLDALAQVGGVKPPVNLTTIQVTRDGRTYRMALADIITQANNNIVLAKDDVITALFQPYSFTVLGAAGKNDEIRFEAMGITLSQALGRFGGLQDGRANPRGVFLFRWDEPATPGGPRVPVIYSFDLKDPAVYFLAQQFRMVDKDLIYITNSPIAELQRFVSIVSQTLLPIATVTTVIQQD